MHLVLLQNIVFLMLIKLKYIFLHQTTIYYYIAARNRYPPICMFLIPAHLLLFIVTLLFNILISPFRIVSSLHQYLPPSRLNTLLSWIDTHKSAGVQSICYSFLFKRFLTSIKDTGSFF